MLQYGLYRRGQLVGKLADAFDVSAVVGLDGGQDLVVKFRGRVVFNAARDAQAEGYVAPGESHDGFVAFLQGRVEQMLARVAAKYEALRAGVAK